MSQTKTVVLTKEAASDLITGGMLPAKKRNRSVKRNGSTDASTTVIKLGHVGGELPPPPLPSAAPIKSISPSSPPIAMAPSSTATTMVPPTGGDHKVVKVELKKKTTAKKVQLQPKKADPPKTTLHSKKTLKKPRKITLGISSMRRRLTRAKKAHSRVRDMPLDQLKKLLIDKKLIKPTSTAPEGILRQIASDAQIVADKSL